ncbi:catalase family peroxidase [Brevibacterium sp.]|uniref:catalase family peroxidase n=1 Tax=Brevibacterium sp. TaxID=1701 RepID=UPI002649008C|nr:catalase family peroxidase [Brevibacterium sp.]MDN6604200.1 catalase family peroxidase [Brevibacterium sp.]
MNEDTPPATPPSRKPVSRRRALIGLSAVGGIGAATIGGFGFARGALTPEKLTPARFADRFEHVFGRHEGFRRNHAKGLSATGYFTSNGAGAEVSTASVFRAGTYPVTGRFSLSGGLPCAPDTASVVRGLGLQFDLPHDEQWRTAMVNIPVLLDSTPQNLVDSLVASKTDPETGEPDQKKIRAYLDDHPETVAAMKIVRQHPPASGFENTTYRGLNAFGFTNEDGQTTPVRWMLVPEEPDGPEKPPQEQTSEDYLFENLVRASSAPLQWRLILTLGQPEDPTNDATKPWPDERRTIDVGTVTINSVQTEAPGNARDINFDPLVLPDGITPLDDPLPAARSSVYARSFARRSRETHHPSKIDAEAVRRA